MSLRQLSLDTSWGPLTLAGGSRAGEGTLVLLPQLRLALDPGRPHRGLPAASVVCVSHGHLDHVGGLGYWASQRFLQNMGAGRVLVPDAIAADVRRLLGLHARLEGGRPYEVEVDGVEAGDERPLRADMTMRFFSTDHWVPTLGCQLVWAKKRLRAELEGLDEADIAARRRAGEAVSQVVEVPLLVYCADTGPALLASRPDLLRSEVVLLECSFFKPADRERAARYGHLHVDDVAASAQRLACRHLVLLHASRRHRLREVEALVDAEIRPLVGCRVHSLNVDWD
jgi:ribonuclease Z